MMRRVPAMALTAILAAGVAPVGCASAMPAGTARLPLSDSFDEGLCTGDCPIARWAIRQEEDGEVAVVDAPGRTGKALRVTAAARLDRVTKADLVARTQRFGAGTLLSIAFDMRAPPSTPLNSIQLVDIECATCGADYNPGIRLYLRNGRLRVDRSKIGVEHAWTRDDAAALTADRWYHITYLVRIGAGDGGGGVRVLLDGAEVLAARGATMLTMPDAHVDRIQIGVTANSNPAPVSLYFDNVRISASTPR